MGGGESKKSFIYISTLYIGSDSKIPEEIQKLCKAKLNKEKDSIEKDLEFMQKETASKFKVLENTYEHIERGLCISKTKQETLEMISLLCSESQTAQDPNLESIQRKLMVYNGLFSGEKSAEIVCSDGLISFEDIVEIFLRKRIESKRNYENTIMYIVLDCPNAGVWIEKIENFLKFIESEYNFSEYLEMKKVFEKIKDKQFTDEKEIKEFEGFKSEFEKKKLELEEKYKEFFRFSYVFEKEDYDQIKKNIIIYGQASCNSNENCEEGGFLKKYTEICMAEREKEVELTEEMKKNVENLKKQKPFVYNVDKKQKAEGFENYSTFMMSKCNLI